jgi:hypothetical protein
MCHLLLDERNRKQTTYFTDVQEPQLSGPGKLPPRGTRTLGIHGACAADTSVAEGSKREAIHTHGTTHSAASPKLFSSYAQNKPVLAKLLEAHTQIQNEAPAAVHLLRVAGKALHVPPIRASFAPRCFEETDVAQLNRASGLHFVRAKLYATGLNGHSHHQTCHLGSSGRAGCRSAVPRGHPVEETRLVQTMSGPAADAIRIGNGDPEFCGSPTCENHWNNAKDDQHFSIVSLQAIDKEDNKMLFPMDTRALSVEVQRNLVRLPDVLEAALQQCDLTDAVDMERTICRVLDHEDVKALLESNANLKPLQDQLYDSSRNEDKAKDLILRWRHMQCANATLVEWNDVLTACVGSNTAILPLGAGQSAAVAMFYLVKYLSKESNEPLEVLAILADAQRHIDKYGSTAADAGLFRLLLPITTVHVLISFSCMPACLSKIPRNDTRNI